MLATRAVNIYGVISPIHSCSKVIGLTSFSIRKDNHQNYEGFVSFYNVLCIIIATTWSFFVVAKYVFAAEMWEMNREYLSTFLEGCTTIVVSSDIVISIFVNWWLFLMRDKLIAILDLIREIDEGLMKLNVPVDHAKHRKLSIIYLTALKTSNVLAVLTLYCASRLGNVFKTSVLLICADYYSTEFFTTLYSQFILFMLMVKIRYQHINDYLLSNLRQRKGLKITDVNKVAMLHNKLVDLVEQLSFCYAVPVSVTI